MGARVRRLTTHEGVLAAFGLVLLGGTVFGPHIADGGFSTDDWSLSAATQYPGPSGLVERFWDAVSDRPVLLIFHPLTHAVLGEDPSLHIAWAVLLAVGASGLLYAVLREVGLEVRHALPIAALTLVFPASDATKLWSTAAIASLATMFCLAGLLVALRGLSERGRSSRRVPLSHVAALALYVLSILTYEATAPVIALFGLLYRLRLPWRKLAARWLLDVCAVAAALLWVATHTARDPKSLADQAEHARVIASEGLTVLAEAVLPFGEVNRWVVLVPLAAVVTAALARYVMLPKTSSERSLLHRWLLAAGAGGLVAVAGWIMFVPAADVYSPLSPGLGNRTNAVSAIGIVLIVYAAAVLASALVERAARGRAHLTNVLPACAAALILVGYVVEVRDDVDVWAVAADREEDVLSRLETARGRPESGTATYAFGYPGYQAPGVPIFATSWDLDGAEKIRWNDSSVTAYPVFTGTTVSCGADRVAPVGAGWRPEHAAAYGRVVFVDLPRERSERIDSAAECRDALSRFRPGPLVG